MTSSIENILFNVLATVGLVLMSGLFSGLTLGLMSLDIVGLQILAQSGHPVDRKRAQTIIPVRRNGNLLLCSLLIGNTITNALLAIFLANLTSGALGLFLSTGLIVIFGEICPQSICSRHGLAIGAKTIYLTRFLIFCLFLISYPISKILDTVLGKEMGNLYSKDELKTLIALHVENPDACLASGLTQEDTHMMTAVLDYQDRKVQDVMTTWSRVYALECHIKLTFEAMLDIHKSGYTRIPVYDEVPDHIIGILYTKDLILIDPDDEVEVKSVLAFHGMDHAQFVSEETTLRETLSLFKGSYSHLMMVISSKKECRVVTGVITLEDVIEEVLNDEIVDESDQYRDNTQKEILHSRTNRPNVTEFFKLFDHKLRKSKALAFAETTAICTYLKAMLPEFSKFRMHVLRNLIEQSTIVEIKAHHEDKDSWMVPNNNKGTNNSDKGHGIVIRQLIYRQDEPISCFSLVLQGNIQIEAGNEKFSSQIGPWGYLGVMALQQPKYESDFEAWASIGCRILQIQKQDYSKALDCNNTMEMMPQSVSVPKYLR